MKIIDFLLCFIFLSNISNIYSGKQHFSRPSNIYFSLRNNFLRDYLESSVKKSLIKKTFYYSITQYKKINKYVNNLYYKLSYDYYSLSEEERTLIENIISNAL